MSFVLAACHGISVIDHHEAEEIKRRRSQRSKSIKDFYHSGGAPISTSRYLRVKFIGDSLEVEVFRRSGWAYLGRPDQSTVPTVKPVTGEWDEQNIWAHPQVPTTGVDTILFPPGDAASDPDGCAIAICRRLVSWVELNR